ncbi:hypothetical protein K466DRAFT_601015 [Polyporus arcularius HHB13444]|uniref:Uncharacterized protein n=1 Tax=Polyporus arcularius HHB13444 TaxID=1314778 RepID=A0A5C3P9P9_9APHY|nr:hypothetical protein K466DRAFT_601015 [Polyporus arcularius HHB13444]
MTSLDHFPNGTMVLPPQRECIYSKACGTWYPRVVSTARSDHFGDGSLAFVPDGKTPYVKHTGRGQWLLAWPSPEHFSTVGHQESPDWDGGSAELASTQRGALQGSRPPDRRARRISNAQEAHVAVFNVSLSDARFGRVEDPDSPTFTGDFADHQKAYVSYEIDALNMYRKQINIRANKKGPYSRSRIAQLLAEDIIRAWTFAKTSGNPLLCDGAEVGLEQINLGDVRRCSRGGIKVALVFTPHRV